MATVKFKGNDVHTSGKLPAIGTIAPDFTGVRSDLSEISLSEFKGKRVFLNIFPSLDTSTCATSVRRFNKEVVSLPNVTVLAISKDLPFAQGRFCTTEGIDNVIPVSMFRDNDFNAKYGVLQEDGPLKGLFARAVVVIDENGKIIYEELVQEISEEPDYEKAITTIR